MHLRIDDDNAIFRIHHPPAEADGATFVFVNALTGTTDHWEGAVAPALREAGWGTLSWNLRGQTDSPFGADVEITDRVIVDDLKRVLDEAAPARPILVGLSIGGLYAARAQMEGARCAGLVLLNTLREIGPRIAWINDALPLVAGHGGTTLFTDAMLPLLVNPEFLAAARPNALKGGYAPLPPEHGHANLLRNSPATDWALDWSKVSAPTLVITGLHDRVFRDPEVIDRLARAIPDHRREDWSDAGHMIPVERPERLVQSLARFAREIEGGAG